MMSDKSNVMTYAGGLWQRVFKEVAKEYSDIQTQHMYVDALCLQMVREPRSLDVIVTNNMFGDIVTDLAAALQGGLGMAASGNIHPGRTSMFEPVHGSAPPIAGKNMANPMGSILTAAMMLAHLGLTAEAQKIENAVLEAVRQKKTTVDVGGAMGTRECAAWIAERVALFVCLRCASAPPRAACARSALPYPRASLPIKNGGRKRSTLSCVTLISRPSARAPSITGLPGMFNCSA
jgi:3-isopropylmalate dehydrogenase